MKSETYNICGRDVDGIENAESHLSALFFDMCSECEVDFGDDSVAWRDFFNNWTDMLNKDGLLCDAGYNDLCPIGDQFE